MRALMTAAAAVLLAAGVGTAAQASPGDPEGWVACVAQAQELSSDGTPASPPKEPVCYDTWEEYASAVTGGRVTSFPAGASAEAKLARIDAVPRAGSAMLLARYWDYTNFRGSFLDWVSEPCTDDGVPPSRGGWRRSYLGDYWNNRISSARVYASASTKCTVTSLYSLRDTRGDYHFCVLECSSMGEMSNRASSMIVSTRPYTNAILPESA